LWREAPFLELAEGAGKTFGVNRRPGRQSASRSKEQFGERKFVPTVIDIETMRKVNKKDGAEHDDHHADCSDSQKSAVKWRGSSELG